LNSLKPIIDKTLENLESWLKVARKKSILFGFDGFLDEIVSVVRIRHSRDSIVLMRSMKEWGERISKAAGSSAGLEVMPKDRRTGGFVANTSQALASFLHPVGSFTMIGNFGQPQILPIFSDLFEKELKCNLFSIGNPGVTNAYEFDDGKIMMSNFVPVQGNRPELIEKVIHPNSIIQTLNEGGLIGIGYWSITPGMEEIYRFCQTQIFPKLSQPDKLDIFLDLADIRKKTDADIQRVISLLNAFTEYPSTTLSLNDREAFRLAAAFGYAQDERTGSLERELPEAFIRLTLFLRDHIKFKRLIIHTPSFALSSTIDVRNRYANNANIITIVPNAYTKSPRFTVAAGDTFNAGFCFGLLVNATESEGLLLGNALTSYFIRSGYRGNSQEIRNLLQNYHDYLAKDTPELLK
jgi:hypothetical protein